MEIRKAREPHERLSGTSVYRVATHLESLGNLEKSGKVCSCIWSITSFSVLILHTSVLILTQNVQKRNYLLGTVVHHMKSERRTGFSYMQVVTKNIVVLKMSRNNVHFIFYCYCCEGQCPVSNHLKCPEKSGMTGEWPPW